VSAIFRLDMLPAREGDCLVLSYGDETRVRRIMVDTGRKATYRSVKARLAAIPAAEREFELLIISHVDRDHIEGSLDMLSDPALAVSFRDVWFNGYRHLGDIEPFGPVQGEDLTRLLDAPGAKWNDRFGGKSAEVGRVAEPITLDGGLALRVLSPGRDELAALVPEWDAACRKAGLVQGRKGWHDRVPPGLEPMGPVDPAAIDVAALAALPFVPDQSKTNATSIAVLAEFADLRVLLAADGIADRLVGSLEQLAKATPGGRVPIAAFKLPHHGSMFNFSPRFLELVDCRRFLVSSNGSYFHHPQPETIARILDVVPQPELIFNYRSDESLLWNAGVLKDRHHYTATYPAEADNGTMSVDLLA
jgi:hypothetical protein